MTTLPPKQVISDQLKEFIRGLKGRNLAEARRHALRLQRQFEQTPFSDGAFMQAARDEDPPFEIVDDSYLRFLAWSDQNLTLQYLSAFLTRYLAYCGVTVQDDKDLFTTTEAAAYLGVAVDTIKKYTHRNGKLTGQLKGRVMVYTRAELDSVAQGKPGRPRKEVKL